MAAFAVDSRGGASGRSTEGIYNIPVDKGAVDVAEEAQVFVLVQGFRGLRASGCISAVNS